MLTLQQMHFNPIATPLFEMFLYHTSSCSSMMSSKWAWYTWAYTLNSLFRMVLAIVRKFLGNETPEKTMASPSILIHTQGQQHGHTHTCTHTHTHAHTHTCTHTHTHTHAHTYFNISICCCNLESDVYGKRALVTTDKSPWQHNMLGIPSGLTLARSLSLNRASLSWGRGTMHNR